MITLISGSTQAIVGTVFSPIARIDANRSLAITDDNSGRASTISWTRYVSWACWPAVALNIAVHDTAAELQSEAVAEIRKADRMGWSTSWCGAAALQVW